MSDNLATSEPITLQKASVRQTSGLQWMGASDVPSETPSQCRAEQALRALPLALALRQPFYSAANRGFALNLKSASSASAHFAS